MKADLNVRRFQILTKFHANIFIWIFLPKLFISICIAHQWKNNILDNPLQLRKKLKKSYHYWINLYIALYLTNQILSLLSSDTT